MFELLSLAQMTLLYVICAIIFVLVVADICLAYAIAKTVKDTKAAAKKAKSAPATKPKQAKDEVIAANDRFDDQEKPEEEIVAAKEEEKQEEPGEGMPAEGETQEESGEEEPAEGETAGGETADGDPAGEDGTGAGTEGAKEELPELHYGQNGLRGTLKAGEEYKAVLRYP